MPRYLILFNAPEPMTAFMARSTPAERQAGMEAWGNWAEAASKTITFEFGAPLQAVGGIAPNGMVKNSDVQASNYAFAEAPSRDVVIEALRDHPHLRRIGASIDVLEVLAMPE